MAEASREHQEPWRRGILSGDQSLGVPPIRPATLAKSRARHGNGTLWYPLRPDADLVGTIQGVDRVYSPLPIAVATRALRGRRVLPPVRGRPPPVFAAARGDDRTGHSRRLQLRWVHDRGVANAHEREGWTPCASRWHELP